MERKVRADALFFFSFFLFLSFPFFFILHHLIFKDIISAYIMITSGANMIHELTDESLQLVHFFY